VLTRRRRIEKGNEVRRMESVYVWRESRIEEVDAMKHKHFTVSCDIDMYPV
jgi:hypothetical protein